MAGIKDREPIACALGLVWLFVTLTWFSDVVNSPYSSFAQKCVTTTQYHVCSPTAAQVAGIFNTIVTNPMANPLFSILIPMTIIALLYQFAMQVINDIVPGEEGEEITPRQYFDTRFLGESARVVRGLDTEIQKERKKQFAEGGLRIPGTSGKIGQLSKSHGSIAQAESARDAEESATKELEAGREAKKMKELIIRRTALIQKGRKRPEKKEKEKEKEQSETGKPIEQFKEENR